MTKRKDAAEVAEAIQLEQDLDTIENAYPIPFEIGGRTYAIRQATPAEFDMIRLQEDLGYHRALSLPEMDDLRHLPVSDETLAKRGLLLRALRAAHDVEEDPDERRSLAERIELYEMPDGRSRAEELAEKFGYRERDRWIVERMTVHKDGTPLDDDERAEVMAETAFFNAATPACRKMLSLAMQVPNWNGRTAGNTG